MFQISLPNLEFRLCNVLVVSHLWLYFSYLSGFKNALLLLCLDKNEKCLSKDR